MGINEDSKEGLEKELKALRKQVRDLLESVAKREGTIRTIRESEEKVRTLVENVNIGVFRSRPDPEGKLLHANSALAKMMGYDSIEEIMKVPIKEDTCPL